MITAGTPPRPREGEVPETNSGSWISVWPLLPRDSGRGAVWGTVMRLRRHGARWFLLLATADMITYAIASGTDSARWANAAPRIPIVLAAGA
jgi:hypothetical protein